jgi:hypothetical protein
MMVITKNLNLDLGIIIPVEIPNLRRDHLSENVIDLPKLKNYVPS